jgi:glycosyltransferase involved in cell wall biosynthesis
MKFSIIIPIYFSQKTIGRCLDSLLSQTVAVEYEIICVGDKVEDPSHTIVEEYSKKYQGVVELHFQAGKGSGGARNHGLSLAKGEYIMFVDADDYVEPVILESCEAALCEYNTDFVHVGFDRVSSDGKRFSNEQLKHEITVVDITKENASRLAFISTAPWGKLFRRELLSGCKFPESPIPCHEDAIFLMSTFPRIRRYAALPGILYHYIVYDDSATTKSTLEKSEKFREYLIALRERFTADGVSDTYLRILDLTALIHVGIADAHRVGENRDLSLRDYCAGAKRFLDTNFPGWRKIKMRPYGRFTLRCKAVWVAKQLYRMNIFWVFIKCYNLMIKTFHKDIKW